MTRNGKEGYMRMFDPANTTSQALFHGFLGGFSSPAMLFAHYDSLLSQDTPESAGETIQPITVRNISALEALSEDVRRVGNDLRIAMGKYAAGNRTS